ncbi:hypothetical protein FIBSPDRAFT_902882 [Athelia psychrophila]|uniref:T6SS Phospholipase effector Tle1-like catalytic domain-containing protein n=1 Tax=Athelia psychrophila TaxID=1759441 RepID=A0A167WPY7_9AGAM|nr:hypothetical protein FIBSPDRAFT_902882 [Fibularhizoctonia sp. CBS 109695]
MASTQRCMTLAGVQPPDIVSMLYKAHPSCSCAPVENGRNLVVCIEGTSHHLRGGVGVGRHDRPTNVSRFFDHLPADSAGQLKYYKNGIGSSDHRLHAPHKIIGNAIDLAIAWNISVGITEAYSWLSEQYRQGDRIFLLGHSRGAYQVRALAAMIETVGLLPEGNKEHIPHAYDIYAGCCDSRAAADKAAFMKAKMSTPGASVHFVGVWDTVSSVGLVNRDRLPLSKDCDHICIFRHALALDENRVMFQPECAFDGGRLPRGDAKEVWFAGSHTDIGGGEGLSERTLNIETIPLQWMEHEALMAGLHFKPHKYTLDVSELLEATPQKAIHGAWRLLPHQGRGRAIYPGQKIHASVAFIDNSYKPKAVFKHAPTLDWTQVIGHGPSGEFLRHVDWTDRLELDLFDMNAAPEWIDILRKNDIFLGTALRILTRLDFMSSLRDGDKALAGVPDAATVLKSFSPVQAEVFLAAGRLLTKLAMASDSISSGFKTRMPVSSNTHQIQCIRRSSTQLYGRRERSRLSSLSPVKRDSRHRVAQKDHPQWPVYLYGIRSRLLYDFGL